MKVSEVVLRSIRDTLSWNVLKTALITALPLAIIWFGIALLLWDPVVSTAESLIGWVPFSILKANGAFLIGGFVWFAAVLITFALIVSLLNVVIFRYVRQEKYTTFSILLLLFIALGWTLFAFMNWDFVYGEVSRVLTWFPFETLQAGVAALLAALVFYNLFIASLSLAVVLMRHSFLKHLQQRDYPDATLVEKGERVKFFPMALRDTGVFFLLLLLFFPLLFVPFVNVGVQLILWAWLIKNAYFLSAASLYAPKEEVQKLSIHQFVLWGIAVIASLLNFIPVINIFAPFFAQIMFFHWVMLNRNTNQ